MPEILKQRGNILFLILLAVVLFAALSYAVTSSLRGGGKDAGSEKAATLAASIVQDASHMTNAVQRLMLTNDCKESELSFENSYDTTYTNSGTRADGKCKLFDPAGGGLSYKVPDPKWFDTSMASVEPDYFGKWYFFNAMCVSGAGGPTSGCAGNGTTSDSDLVVLLPFLKKDVCTAINDALGIPRRDTSDVLINSGDVFGYASIYKYKGSFYSWGATQTFHLTVTPPFASNFYYKPYGCFEHSASTSSQVASGKYAFYAILLQR